MEHLTSGAISIITENLMKMVPKKENTYTFTWYQLFLSIVGSLETNSLNSSKVKNSQEDLCPSVLIPNGMTGIYMICTIANIYLVKVNQENITIQIMTWLDLMIPTTGTQSTELTELRSTLLEKLSELHSQE